MNVCGSGDKRGCVKAATPFFFFFLIWGSGVEQNQRPDPLGKKGARDGERLKGGFAVVLESLEAVVVGGLLGCVWLQSGGM